LLAIALASVLTAVVLASLGLSDGFTDEVTAGDGEDVALSVTGVDGVQALTVYRTKPAAKKIYFFMSKILKYDLRFGDKHQAC
jgi:hypothetical protein